MPTIETQIWLALKSGIDSLPLSYPIAWPAEKFTAVMNGYIRVGTVSADPARSIIPDGGKYTRAGFLMLTLVMPMNNDTSVFTELAGQIANHFKDTLKMRYGSLCVTITANPHVMDGYEDNGYWSVPVRIPWRCYA